MKEEEKKFFLILFLKWLLFNQCSSKNAIVKDHYDHNSYLFYFYIYYFLKIIIAKGTQDLSSLLPTHKYHIA